MRQRGGARLAARLLLRLYSSAAAAHELLVVRGGGGPATFKRRAERLRVVARRPLPRRHHALGHSRGEGHHPLGQGCALQLALDSPVGALSCVGWGRGPTRLLSLLLARAVAVLLLALEERRALFRCLSGCRCRRALLRQSLRATYPSSRGPWPLCLIPSDRRVVLGRAPPVRRRSAGPPRAAGAPRARARAPPRGPVV